MKKIEVALDSDEIEILESLIPDLEADSSTIEGALILGIANQILLQLEFDLMGNQWAAPK